MDGWIRGALTCVFIVSGLTACSFWQGLGKVEAKSNAADLAILRCDGNPDFSKLSIFEIESLLFVLVNQEHAFASKHLIADEGHYGTMCFEIHRAGRLYWHVEATLGGLDLEDNQKYTVSFQAKSDRAREISLECQLDHSDWHNLGLKKKVSLEANVWKEQSFDFVARKTGKNHNKLSFYFGDETGKIWLSRVSIRKSATPINSPSPLGASKTWSAESS